MRAISETEATDSVNEQKIDYIETSSKSGESLIAEKVLETSEFGNECSFTLDGGLDENNKKKCC